jgi:Na+:H+ antiporter, NhaA family
VATAGVLIGLLTPVRAWLGPEGFAAGVRKELEQLSDASSAGLSNHDLARTLRHVDAARREAMSPAENLIEALHPWVAFLIMPVFALANAGVSLGSFELAGVGMSVATGVGAGLVLGKPLGILLACWLALRTGLGALPTGVGWRHLLVLALVGGVGFTMSLFIAPLAFTDPEVLAAGKVGVLAASGMAAGLGLMAGWLLLGAASPPGAAPNADEAEGPRAGLADSG